FDERGLAREGLHKPFFRQGPRIGVRIPSETPIGVPVGLSKMVPAPVGVRTHIDHGAHPRHRVSVQTSIDNPGHTTVSSYRVFFTKVEGLALKTQAEETVLVDEVCSIT